VAADAGFVETVRGPVAPADLGIALTHEHLFMDLSAPRLDTDDPEARRGWSDIVLDDADAMVQELASARAITPSRSPSYGALVLIRRSRHGQAGGQAVVRRRGASEQRPHGSLRSGISATPGSRHRDIV
jgi:predicted metal-dependent phosphotriesterase family hydrolase